MKPTATLEDYKNREKFLIKYIESQINKNQSTADQYNSAEHYYKCGAYKDILFKLTKDDSDDNRNE